MNWKEHGGKQTCPNMRVLYLHPSTVTEENHLSHNNHCPNKDLNLAQAKGVAVSESRCSQ